MDLDFPLILVVLTAVAGAMWLVDKFYLSRQREERASPPWYVESTAPFFPVLFVVLVLRSFLLEPFQIPSGSMIPTLKVGDFIVVNKFAYGLRLPIGKIKFLDVDDPARGDVMVFFPPNDKRYFIKRVIGLPGDEVRVTNNVLYVNGEEMRQSSLDLSHSTFGRQDVSVDNEVVIENLSGVEHLLQKNRIPGRYGRSFFAVVPEGHYFMMGDNRDNSYDSRGWGPVPKENIVGKAFAVWMHWEQILSIPSFATVGMIR